MKLISVLIGVFMLVIAGTVGFLSADRGVQDVTFNDLGSVNIANEYHFASTTEAGAKVLQATRTTLGSVTIVKTSAQTVEIKNATSTTDALGTVVATFPASAVVGTYVFDTVLDRGLIVTAAASYAGEFITLYR